MVFSSPYFFHHPKNKPDTYGQSDFPFLQSLWNNTSSFHDFSCLDFLCKWKKFYSTSCEELIHWKRLWCWEGLGVGGKGDGRGWDGWMASPTQWTWVWVNSRSWWWTGRPGMLQFMGSQRVGHDWATELNWLTLVSMAGWREWKPQGKIKPVLTGWATA